VALAVAALEKSAQAPALEALLSDAGPDADVLALSTVQCGRVLAWNPPLLATPVAEKIVDALLELLAPSRPRPLLELVAAALGPIAAAGALPGAAAGAVTLRERILRRARAGLESPAKPSSFAAELAAVERNRWLDEPQREIAATCAFILGVAAPIPRDEFVAHRAPILDNPDLMQPFVDGLVALPHVPALGELAMELVDAGQGEAALALASEVPLDELGDFLVATLDAPSAAHRAMAVAAVELIKHDDADAALAGRLSDPSPEVTAAAACALLARGRRDLVGRHSAREVQPARRAAVLASLGELSVPVIGELVRGVLVDLETGGAELGPSPVTRLVGEALLTSVAGLDVAADLIGGVPEAAGLLALARVTERDIAVTAPPGVRARFADACFRVPDTVDDEELEALALYLLARVSAGDSELASVLAERLATTTGSAASYLAALGELRVATVQTGEAIAPHVAATSPIGARVIAAAICGRALPADHRAWADVRELLSLGTIARAAAWSALRDRARRG
jgi:hypothetical protein